MKIEESTFINRPAEEVFAFFDDRTNDKRWMAVVIESGWSDPNTTTGIGRRGRMVMNVMGRREFTDEVIEYQPGMLVAHRAVSGSMVINTACIARPEGDGSRVTVTYEAERLPGGVFGRLLTPFSAKVVRRNYKADLARLKDMLETQVKANG